MSIIESYFFSFPISIEVTYYPIACPEELTHSSFFQSSVQCTSVKRTIDNRRTNTQKIRVRTKEENKVTLIRYVKPRQKRGEPYPSSCSVLHGESWESWDRWRTVASITRLERWHGMDWRRKRGGKEGRKERVFFDVRPRRDEAIKRRRMRTRIRAKQREEGEEKGEGREIKESWISIRRSNERNRGLTFGTVSAILDEINGTTKWEQKCRGRVEGSIGAMRGAGLSSRKSEFILNVSLCMSVYMCVFHWGVFLVVLSSREFLFRYLNAEDWKVELIAHTESFNFFSFSRNRLNDESTSFYLLFDYFISIHFSPRK